MTQAAGREERIAAVVVAHLRSDGWDVYSEVQVGRAEPVADIVAVRSDVLHVVECKASMGMAVLAQAERWLPHAHLVSVAVESAGRRHRDFCRRVCDWLGVGWYSVGGSDVAQVVRAEFRRQIAPQLRDALREQQKTFAPAGNAESRRWTPFRETCQNVAAAVARRPDGLSAGEVARIVKHHYTTDATATHCILKWARVGKVAGVRVVQDGRRFRLVSDKLWDDVNP